MNTRTIFTAGPLLWAFAVGLGVNAQEIGSNSTSANPGLYRSVDTPIKIRPSFRQENESDEDDSEGYSPYPGGAEMPVIPPPPVPKYESEPEMQADPEPQPERAPEPVAIPAKPVEEVKEIVVKKEEVPEPPRTLEETFEPVRETVATVKPVQSAPVVVAKPTEVARVEMPPTPQAAPEPVAVRRPQPAIPAPPIPAQTNPAPSTAFPPQPPAVVHAQPVPIDQVYSRSTMPDPVSVDPLPRENRFPAGEPSRAEIKAGPTVENLRHAANIIAARGVPYKFGRNHPAFGGLDSPGAVQHILSEIGVNPVPRSIQLQQTWLRINHMMHEFRYRPSVTELGDHLIPGSLLFWGDYQTGKVTHVMIYLGYDASRAKYLAFGTRGGREVGIHGHEVDIFELKLDRERIIGTGRIPGLIHL